MTLRVTYPLSPKSKKWYNEKVENLSKYGRKSHKNRVDFGAKTRFCVFVYFCRLIFDNKFFSD